jgi:penicillin-binding protein 1C
MQKLFFGSTAILLTLIAVVVIQLNRDVISLPAFGQIKAQHPASDAQLLDRHGHVIQTRRMDYSLRSLPWSDLNQVSHALRKAIIKAEDKHFFEHNGIDWRASLVALWQTGTGRFKRGASTLTMQLASSLAPKIAGRSGGRTLKQKWGQLRVARQIEREWSKDQILEAYVNRVDYRGELHGITAAALGLFDKAPSGLNNEESAILAALLRAPNAKPRRVAQRACDLLEYKNSQCHKLVTLSLALQDPTPLATQTNEAPSLGRHLLTRVSKQVTSTIERSLQRDVTTLLQRRLQQLRSKNVGDAAAIVLDNTTGDVLAYVGNGGKYSSAHHVDGIRSPRQAGSTLKPFLYGMALQDKMITAASVLEDAPLTLATDVGLYTPQNYDRRFRGAVTTRNALAGSLNVPAVRTLDLIGPEPFAIHLNQLGYAGLTEPGEHYGHSLALGSAEVTLLEQANAYRTLANGGKLTPVRFKSSDPVTSSSHQVISTQASFIVADILADRSARANAFGLSNPLATPFWSAVKTGTSKDMRDNWCIGFSTRFTVAVWVGNFNGEPMHDVSGISGAGPLWNDIMNRLHGPIAPSRPKPPSGLQQVMVRFDQNFEPPRKEWFLPGTETQQIALATQSEYNPRIIYPAADSIIAIDPDIPARHQRVFLKTSASGHQFTWHLNGIKLKLHTESGPSWQPVVGNHHLTLTNPNGEQIDSVKFEVR